MTPTEWNDVPQQIRCPVKPIPRESALLMGCENLASGEPERGIRGTLFASNLEPIRRVVYSQEIILRMKLNSCWLRVGCALIGVLAAACAQADADTKHSATLSHLGGVDAIIEQAVADGNIPGAVLVVGHDGAVVYRKA